MVKRFLFSLFVIAITAFAIFAQAAYTPEKGSAERAAILDALRVPVEKNLKQKIIFRSDNFKIQGNWAFLNGTPQNPGGGEPDYKGTKYQQLIKDGVFDNNFSALLKKTSGKWRIITYRIGCTDVCYYTWWSEYKAPKAIFPSME